MLSDLLQLEEFYGHLSCAAFFEDLIKEYDPKSLQNAMKAGDIQVRRVFCGREAGRFLVWLSPQGRQKALV